MQYQLKQSYLDQLKTNHILKAELIEYAAKADITVINAIRNNDNLLVKVGVLIWLRDRLAPNEPIETLIEPKPITATTTQAAPRAGVEL